MPVHTLELYQIIVLNNNDDNDNSHIFKVLNTGSKCFYIIIVAAQPCIFWNVKDQQIWTRFSLQTMAFVR